MGSKLDERLPYSKAELVWICRNEMPVTLEDLLARRTRALFLNVQASIEIASQAAEIMAGEMGYDSEWQKDQLKIFNELAKNYI
jgi:glycerol-3-phosphate dehydrogenase